MSKDLTKLHYQMLRKTADSGTTMDGALSELKTKIQGDSVQPGEPVVIFYDDPSGNTGAHLAVPTSGVTAETAEGYIFANRKEVFDRMEEDEEVTTAALIDLDDRVTTVSGDVVTLRQDFDNMGDTFAEIKLTENVKAMGVSAGAINNGQTVSSGTSFTEFVKKLLIKTLDYTPVKPKLEWASTAQIPSNTIEVGTNASFTFATDKTNGSFTGTTENGFNPAVSGAGDTFGTVTYTVLSGDSSVITATSGTSYTINPIPEGDYTVTATVPYTGVNASDLGLKKNTGEVSQASFPSATASASTKTFSVRYKAYYGLTTATGNTTSNNFVFTGDNNNVSKVSNEWLNTSGDKIIKSTTWSNEGKNMFVLIPSSATLSYIESSMKVGTNLKDDFILISSNYSVTIGGGQTATYKLYLKSVNGGTVVDYQKLTITK